MQICDGHARQLHLEHNNDPQTGLAVAGMPSSPYCQFSYTKLLNLL